MSATGLSAKDRLLGWIENDRERLIEFLRQFIRCKSPNPPGDTLEAAAHVTGFLDENGLGYRIIAPNKIMPNIVASLDCARPGRHLVLNGHIDVFPVEEGANWSQNPWGGDLVDGRIYGRGSADMKCGTTASIFTYYYLNRIRDQLKGTLTLTVVSDEETFGPWGARYLFDHHPEIYGDCCLNGEPSSPHTVRFGEKGPLWLEFKVKTKGAHGAYTHASRNANSIAMDVIGELRKLTDLPVPRIGNLSGVLDSAAEVVDKAFGPGASAIVQKITMNPGLMRGGVKVNMVAAECLFEVDFRLPNGIEAPALLAEVDKIVARNPEVTYRTIVYNPPAWTPPDTEMFEHVCKNSKLVANIAPVPVISLGGTDARLWRYKGIPAIVYGPTPNGMGSTDEYVAVEEFMHVVKCHVLSAYDFLTKT
jgi:succinyl-diaminopimelate desuccinylase